MADWTVCPECDLKHSIRPDGRCPRCNADLGGSDAVSGSDAAKPPADPGAPAATPDRPPPPPPPVMPAGADVKTVAIPLGCANHPTVITGLMRCDQCGRTFCSDCVIARENGVFCTGCRTPEVQPAPAEQAPPPPEPVAPPPAVPPPPESPPPPAVASSPPPASTPTPRAAKLTVMEGLRAGWQVATEDFWQAWLIAFLFCVITAVASLPGMIPLIGILWAIAYSLVVAPPLQAGLVLAVMRKVDGGGAHAEDLFEGFKQRFGSSIVVMLPIWATVIVFMVVMFGMAILIGGLGGAMAAADSAAAEPPSAGPSALLGVLMTGVMLVFGLLMAVISMVMWFGYVALWESHQSGPAAVIAGWNVVRENLLNTIFLAVMMFLIVFGGTIAGVLAVCVGYLITMPFVMIWLTATIVILYRSWAQP